jgi:hypothetical protein
MVAFRRLFVDFELSSIWERAFVFKDVQLDAPLARAVIRPDGSVNLSDLVLPDEEDKQDEPLPAIWIKQFALGEGTVEFADLARRVPLDRRFTPVHFKLENFRTTPEGGAFGLTAETQNAELLEWRGTFALAPQVASAGDLAVTKLHLPGALEVAGVELPFVIPQGEMNLRGSYKFALNEPMQLDVHLPQMQIDGLSLRARGLEQDYVAVPTVVISETKIAMPANTVSLGTIAAAGVVASMRRSRGSPRRHSSPPCAATASIRRTSSCACTGHWRQPGGTAPGSTSTHPTATTASSSRPPSSRRRSARS